MAGGRAFRPFVRVRARILVAFGLLSSVGVAASCAGLEAGRMKDTRRAEDVEAASAAEAAVLGLFDAMRRKDCAAMRELVEPDARIHRLGPEGELRVVTADAFIPGVCEGEAIIDERPTGPSRVEVSGDLAAVWVPYALYLDGVIHHTGVDAVQLRRVAGGSWRVLAISYTAVPASSAPVEAD